MPQRTPPCQLGVPTPGDSRLISPRLADTECPHPTPDEHTSTTQFEQSIDYSAVLVHGDHQEVAYTASRRSGPRRWLRAVGWLIAAGLHPRANATTQLVADDLAARMDYDTGHVRYQLDDMVDRLGIARASVARHIKCLRELGALAWVQHGSRANRMRQLGLKGYAGTATVYAAVIPAAFDDAMGHTIVGSGYTARIIVDFRKRPANPVDTSGNPPVDNSGSEDRETPSLYLVEKEGQVQMGGGFTTTAARTRTDSTPGQTTNRSSRARTRSGGKKRATILGNTVTAAGMQLGAKLADAIRRRVPWTRKATHDELRWVCADMGEQQWTEDQAVRFAVEAGHGHGAGFAWHPDRPHRIIAAELHAAAERQQQDQQIQDDLAQAVSWENSTAGRAAAERASLANLFAPAAEAPEPERTNEDRLRARMDWNVWPEVIAHYEDDPDDALDLYGKRLVCFAIDQQARHERHGAWA